MRRFIIQIAVFIVITMSLFLLILSTANGKTDNFYLRFTTPQQTSMILGTSRAAQGVLPTVIDSLCGGEMYNYAFTVDHSPYGEVYLNSIKAKLAEGTTNGLFILCVDPWSISSVTEDPNDEENFREKDKCVGNTSWVNSSPNFIYLINNFKGKYYSLLSSNSNSKTFLHDDGWLEVSIDMDSLTVDKRITSKVNTYKKYSKAFQFSSVRLKFLKQTVDFLSQHGEVYIVRLPIHSKLYEVENEFMPDFNDKINEITKVCNGYLDLSPQNDSFVYTDGNHLYKKSAFEISCQIGEWIIKTRN